MGINPVAITLWVFTMSLGFVLSGGTLVGLVAGLAVGSGLSFIVEMFL